MFNLKKAISMLVAISMVVGLMAGMSITASAAQVDDVAIISGYAGNDNADALTVAQLNSALALTVSIVKDANLAAYKAAIVAATAILADTAAEIQAIVTKVNLDEAVKFIANYGSSVVPTAAPSASPVPALAPLTLVQITDAGVTGAITANLVIYSNALKTTVALPVTLKDTTAEIQVIINTSNTTQSGIAVAIVKGYAAADNAGALTIAQLEQASVTGVVTANLGRYKLAIVALANDATLLDTTAKIQALVNTVNSTVTEENRVAAVELIKGYAANDFAPTTLVNTLKEALVTGTVDAYLGVHATDITKSTGYIGEIERAIQTSVDSTAKIQAIITAYNTLEAARVKTLDDAIIVIKGYAGNDDASALTIAQLISVGVTGAMIDNLGTHNAVIAFSTGYMQVIEQKIPTDVDSTVKIQALINNVNSTQSTAAINSIKGFVTANVADTLTITMFVKAGVTGATDANLVAYKGAMVNLTNVATLVDTTVKIQDLVTKTNVALVAIEAYTVATVTALTSEQLLDAGVLSVVTTNLDAYKVAIGAVAVGAADTIAEIQAIVYTVNNAASFVANLKTIEDYTSATVSGLTSALLTAVGVTAVNNAYLSSYQSAVGAAAVGAADTTAKIQAIINVINVRENMIITIAGYAANDDASALTIADLKLIGMDATILKDEYLVAYKAKIVAAIRDNADTMLDIQALIVAVNAEQIVAVIAKIEAYTATTALDLTIAQLTLAGVTSLNASNLDKYKVAIGVAVVGAADTTAKIQTIINTVNSAEKIAAIAIIHNYAGNDDASSLTIAQLVVAEIVCKDVNLAAYKVGIAAAGIGDDIQTIINNVDIAQSADAVKKIKSYAFTDNASTLTITELLVAGVEMTNAKEVNLAEYKIAIATRAEADVDTIAKIQALVTLVNSNQDVLVAVNVIKAYAGNAAALTIAQLTAAGITTLSANLDLYKIAIAESTALAIDTAAKIQAIITAADDKIVAVAAIDAYGAGAALLTIDQLKKAGVTNLVVDNLNLYKNAIGAALAQAADTTAKIQAIIDTTNIKSINDTIVIITGYAGNDSVVSTKIELINLLTRAGVIGAILVNVGEFKTLATSTTPAIASTGYIKAIEDAKSSEVDSTAKIQAIINGVNVIKASANVVSAKVGTIASPIPSGTTDSSNPTVIVVGIAKTVTTVLPTDITVSAGAVLTLYTNIDFTTGLVPVTGTTLSVNNAALYAKIVSENGTVTKYYKLVFAIEDPTAKFVVAKTQDFTKVGSNFVAKVSIERGTAVTLTDAKLYAIYTAVDGKQIYQSLEIGSLTSKDIVVNAGFKSVQVVLVNGDVDWSLGFDAIVFKSNSITLTLPTVA